MKDRLMSQRRMRDRPGAADRPGISGLDDSDLYDLDLLEPSWTPPRRVNRWTGVLLAGLVAVTGFAAGVLVQKNHDAGLVDRSSGAAAAARAFGRAGDVPGGAGGLGPSGSSSGGSSSGGSGSGGSGSGAGLEPPVVVGSVVSAGQEVLVVQDFAGTRTSVRVLAGTPVTTPGLTGLRPGVTVAVTGTKAADGTVTASSVVSRSRS
jgi:hypothetical protein